MRVGFFDFEMSSLNANYGQLLCGCFLEYDSNKKNHYGKLKTYELDDYENRRWDDKGLAKRLRDAFSEYDIVVSYNGVRFDVPFLNTRLRYYDLKPLILGPPLHKDLLYTARYKLRLSSNSLKSLEEFLGLSSSKTKIDPQRWVKAVGGHRPSYNYIIQHCKLDVKVLCEAWDKLKLFITEIK